MDTTPNTLTEEEQQAEDALSLDERIEQAINLAINSIINSVIKYKTVSKQTQMEWRRECRKNIDDKSKNGTLTDAIIADAVSQTMSYIKHTEEGLDMLLKQSITIYTHCYLRHLNLSARTKAELSRECSKAVNDKRTHGICTGAIIADTVLQKVLYQKQREEKLVLLMAKMQDPKMLRKFQRANLGEKEAVANMDGGAFVEPRLGATLRFAAMPVAGAFCGTVASGIGAHYLGTSSMGLILARSAGFAVTGQACGVVANFVPLFRRVPREVEEFTHNTRLLYSAGGLQTFAQTINGWPYDEASKQEALTSLNAFIEDPYSSDVMLFLHKYLQSPSSALPRKMSPSECGDMPAFCRDLTSKNRQI